PFNTAQAAFVLRNAFLNFPEGSIHLILVNTEPSPANPVLAVKSRGHFFIGTDNGIFSLILGEELEKAVKINENGEIEASSFTALGVFTSAAAALADGKKIDELGEKVDAFQKRVPLRPTIEDKAITGSVIYIDSYQNAITNISKDLFERISQGRKFELFVQSKHYKITRLSNKYNDVQAGDMLALFNSTGLLEIAINNGNAARLLSLDSKSTIRIEFLEK
ncbi:MAG TPA: SAM-dependent chlorinase/fluorinase, partial [Bacteroidales bacterium]|nr:SAM-dependent chlorinase/fluorinase [Bacteroidales bacterium]